MLFLDNWIRGHVGDCRDGVVRCGIAVVIDCVRILGRSRAVLDVIIAGLEDQTCFDSVEDGKFCIPS